MNIKKYISQITLNLLVIFPLFLILPVGTSFSSICLGIIAALTFFYALPNIKSIKVDTVFFWITIPFFVYLLGLINSSDIAYGWKFSTRNICLLLFPLIFLVWANRKIPFKKIIIVYIVGSVVTSIYLAVLFIYYFNLGTKFYKIVSIDIFHSTYLGMYVLSASLLAFHLYLKEKKWLYLILTIFLFISSLLCGSRIIFLCAFMLLGFYLYQFIGNKKIVVTSIVFSCLIFFLMITSVPSIKEKFFQIIDLNEIGFDKKNYYSLSLRLGKLEAATNVIKKYPLFGAGTGDLINELIIEYEKMDFTMGYKNGYNPHNQYLDNLARNGFIGGGLVLFCLYIAPLYVAIRAKNTLLFGYMSIIMVVSLTESILVVHRGLLFYSFFTSFLIAYNKQITLNYE